jgi:hypothetical protein
VLRANLKWKLVARVVGSCLVLLLAIGITGCEQTTATPNKGSIATIASDPGLTTTDGPLAEVNMPESITKLAPRLDKFQPQVQILSPKPDEILTDDLVSVKLQVNDLQLFKNAELGLGNHLHVILDKQTYQGVYDLTQPLVFKNLAAGTHSLRVFASRPWHESFKNEGAYAQTTFHVLTKTPENNPNPQQPLLTYSRPAGTYSAEPIMLDYYLTNAPSHLVANGSPESLPDWRIRVTVNGQRFIVDRWAPIYLQGFKQGKNWVRLELVDDRGNPIPNVYNDTVGIVTYNPQTKDALARLIRGELNDNLARTLVDPSYVATQPTPTNILPPVSAPAMSEENSGLRAAVPTIAPSPVSTPVPTSPSPTYSPSPSAIVAPPIINNTPTVTTQPSPTVTSMPIDRSISQPSPQPVSPPSAVASPAPVAPNGEVAIKAPGLPVVIMPAPVEIKPTVAPSPQPIVTPSSVPTIQPIPSPPPANLPVVLPITTAPPLVTKPSGSDLPLPVAPALQPRSIPTPIATPATAVPTATEPDRPAWQTQAIELLKVAGEKTRAFTNTIPDKAQRFSHNVQIWTGKAIETIQSWRNRPEAT